jgi:hypothetical protein
MTDQDDPLYEALAPLSDALAEAAAALVIAGWTNAEAAAAVGRAVGYGLARWPDLDREGP